MLSREESPRLAALDSCLLARLLAMLREPPTPDALLAALGAITCLAEAYPVHRYVWWSAGGVLGWL